jgi:pyruvate kinase
MLLNFLARKRTSMKKDEIFQQVKAGEISLNDAREALGYERVDHTLMNTKLTNSELLKRRGQL